MCGPRSGPHIFCPFAIHLNVLLVFNKKMKCETTIFYFNMHIF